MSDLLATVTTSEKRKRLLLLLLGGPRSLDEIKKLLNVTASGMLPQIKILEEEGIVFKENGLYQLTEIGRLIAYHLEQFDRILNVIEEQKKFWQEHDLQALPQDFFFRLGDIKKPRLLEAGFEESFEPHSEFLSMILQSDTVAGISPIVHPIYPRFFLAFAEKGKEVEIILTKKAYDKIKKEYHTMLLKGLQHENARLYICDEAIRFAYIVTDRYFSMGLSMKNGVFDSMRDIVSNEALAVRYGKDLFSYYRAKSHRVNTDGTY